MLGKLKAQPGAAFGRVLRTLRRERGLSQEGLALEADLQRNYVSLIERGINQPTITTISQLAPGRKALVCECLPALRVKDQSQSRSATSTSTMT
jgi:transcriptional regulator with XRE-family HTH domain